MKRPLFCLPAALALALLLTACGGSAGNADTGLTKEDGVPVPGQNDHILTDPDSVPDTSDDSEDTLTGGVSIDQMLRNARVHDRDGDLLDRENAMTPGADRW